jgi:hypothetical protein
MPFFASGGNTYGYQGQFNTYQAPFNLTNSIGGGKLVVWFDPTLYCGSGNWFDRSRNNVLIAQIENGAGIKTDANRGVLTASSNNYRFPPGPSTSGIAYMSSFTISAWVKRLGALSTNSAIITQSWSNSGGRNLQMYASEETQITAGFFSTNTYTPGVSASLMCNVWQNVTLRFSNGQMNLYLNGADQGGSTISISPENTDRFYRIGRSWDVAEYFNGEIGDLMLYNSGFSSEAALELFQKMKSKYGISDPVPSLNFWATLLGGTASDSVPIISRDLSGNIYITGQYSSSNFTINSYSNVSNGVIFLSTFGTLSNFGNSDFFLSKYNSSGSALWTTSITGTNFEFNPFINSDNDGNTYIAGYYLSGPITINSYSNINNQVVHVSRFGTLAKPTDESVVFAKYNPSGNVQWVTRLNAFRINSSVRIITDTIGDVIVTGEFRPNLAINIYSNVSNSIILVSTFATLSSIGSGTTDIFITKYNSSGIPQWATRIGGSGNDINPNIVTDTDNNIYVSCQSFTSTTIFSYSTITNSAFQVSTFGTLSNAGQNDIMLAKYNSSGIAQLGTSIGGLSNDTLPTLATDSSNNVYIAGQFQNSSVSFNNFDTLSNTTINTILFGSLTNDGGNDIFLAKYNSSGSAEWVTKISGTNDDLRPIVQTDINNNVYITGYYSNTNITFNNYSNVDNQTIYLSTYGTLSNTGNFDIFLAKYNSSGACQWVTRIEGTGNEANGFIAVDNSSESLYITGQSASSTIILNVFSNVSNGVIYISTIGTLSNIGGNDIFLAKYTQ